MTSEEQIEIASPPAYNIEIMHTYFPEFFDDSSDELTIKYRQQQVCKTKEGQCLDDFLV